VLTAIHRLFDSSKNLDISFKDFVNALCKLNAEMVGLQASELAIQVDQQGVEESGGSQLTLPMNQSQENVVQRRRVSGIYIPKNLVWDISASAATFFMTRKHLGPIANVWGLWDR